VSRRTAHWRLTVRKAFRVTNLRATFEGVRAPVEQGIRRGRQSFRVTIEMTGLRRGEYVARVRYRLTRTSTGQSRSRTRIHYYRPCYGNPKGGGLEGPNTNRITIL
jgi:hypothetical protein